MANTRNRNNILEMACPTPLNRYPAVVLGHGSGGRMTQELIENLFLPTFGSITQSKGLADAAVVELSAESSEKLAFTTDSFVIRPLVFPGGDIGKLAINGTVNDLAMMGATPLYLSVGLIIEEGLPTETLSALVKSMARAAKIAGVSIVTGDTKVVEKNHGDGLYINTSGVGVIKVKDYPHPKRISPGDVLIVNGTLGDHGMAIMSVRENLRFDSQIISDCAPLNKLVLKLLKKCPGIHAMRDLTRGGLAAALNELAKAAHVGMLIDEGKVPVNPQVAGACEIMGLDPINIANEGKFLVVVPESQAEVVLKILKADPLGKRAAIIGEVVKKHQGVVVGETFIGSERIIDMPAGELLPRIC